MFPRFLAHFTEWVKAHRQINLEFEERGSHTWVFLWSWRKEDFYRVAAGLIGHYYGDASCVVVFFLQDISVIGKEHLWCHFLRASHTLIECYKEYFGSGYTKRLLDYPLSTSDCLNAAYKKLLLPCVER